jgi:hypothetical protein
MLATLASAAAAPPLAPPGAADAPTLDLYVGDERRTTITTNFGTATDAINNARSIQQRQNARWCLRRAWRMICCSTSYTRVPRRRVRNQYVNNACTWVGFCRYPRPFRYQIDGRAIVLSENGSDFGRADLTMN